MTLVQPELRNVLVPTVYNSDLFGRMFFEAEFSAPKHSILEALMDLFDAEPKAKDRKDAAAAPRGVGKTTSLIYGDIARRICHRHNNFIVYVTNTATNAEMQTENLKYGLQTNEKIRRLFGPIDIADIEEEYKNTFSKKAWIAYNNTLILPRGAGQQIRGLLWRGHRPDLYIFDDLEKKETVESDEQRAKLRSWFFADAMGSISQYTTKNGYRMHYIDTLKHEDSLLQLLLDDPSWHSIRLEACDDNFKPTAPEYMDEKKIRETHALMVRAGEEDSFYREYRNLPVSKATQSFKRDHFHYCTEHGGKLNLWTAEYETMYKKFIEQKARLDAFPTITEPYSETLGTSRMITIVIGDPAKTIKATSAESGVIVASVSPKNKAIFIREAIGERLEPDGFLNRILDLAVHYGARYVGVETTSLNLYVEQPFENEIRRRALPIKFIPFSARGKKEGRVRGLVPYYKNGYVVHVHGKCDRLESQLLSFPFAKLWDVMDAAAYVIPFMEEEGIFFEPDDFLELPEDDEFDDVALEEDEEDYPFEYDSMLI